MIINEIQDFVSFRFLGFDKSVFDNGKSTYLVIGDGCLSVAGELHQRAEVGAQVRLTSNQQHLGVGTELLNLPFPLWRKTKPQSKREI